MADTKLTGLGTATPAVTDILYFVKDPGSSPVSHKTTFQNVLDLVGDAGLSFNTISGPITLAGGDSGQGDPALIIDDTTDEYLVVRFPHFVQFNLDGDGGVLGNFYVEQGTFTTNLTVDNARSANALEVNSFNISVTETDLTTSDAMSNTAVRSTYGTGGVASKGTLQNLVSSISVQGIGDAVDEYTALLSVVSVDIGTGYTQSTGPVGRAWGLDLNLLGPVGVQPNLLNGTTQLVHNAYNGSPADSPSGGMWIVTRPNTGGGIDAIHAAATTYPIDVGLGIVGYSGASTTTTPGAVGFTTGIQIGGHGSGWMPNTENSLIGTGIDISQCSSASINFHDGFLQCSERTAPSAPAGNNVVIYAQDNGAGKTQLMALFSSGAAQQIAIQP